jgi:uncharacterized protein with beta-barrel porin domain
MTPGVYMPGTIIDCSLIAGQTITLSSALPGISLTGSLTINGANVTINGGGPGNNFQAFSIGMGALILSNLNIKNCTSKGGDGGNGFAQGGGGGAGGGGGLYVHNGAAVVMSGVNFMNNQAVGGAGGSGGVATNGGGGGGGGYSGGKGGSPVGGGGGGNNEGGAGGDSLFSGSNGLNYGGAGGGGGGAATSGGNVINPITPFSGGVGGASGGGGGAGAGGPGFSGTLSGGGMGGIGIGIDNGFGSGGGGGGQPNAATNGGAATGTGGGGGSGGILGGNGGPYGGGGGGGASTGGTGGFGSGGGGGDTTAGTSPLFPGGGGAGGLGSGSGGGGGAGMGGAVFVHNGGIVAIGDVFGLSGNTATGGLGGMGMSGGATDGSNGAPFGQDIFLRSGGTLIFNNNLTTITLANAIQSENPPSITFSLGGLIMNGAGTLVLSSTVNSYTSGTTTPGTTINSGLVQIVSDGSLGQTPTTSQPTLNSMVIGNGTLQLAASISSITTSRYVVLNGSATIDTQANPNSLTILGLVSGSGSLTKNGTGTLALASGNTYLSGTTISSGLLNIVDDTSLGASLSLLTIGAGTLGVGSSFTSSRPIMLTNTLSTMAFAPSISNTFTGTITGPGKLTLTMSLPGMSTVTLVRNNSYSGGTLVSPGITLQGNSNSLQGNIQDNGALIFNQTFSGSYGGSLSGTGLLTIQGGDSLDMTGNSGSFTGTVSVLSGTTLTVDGTLGASSVSVSGGAFLNGSGLIGAPVSNRGQITPGNSIRNVLMVAGPVDFISASSSLVSNLSPTSTSVLAVGSTVSLTDGTLIINPAPGFYRLSMRYTVLTALANTTTFSSVICTSPDFRFSVIYDPDPSVIVLLQPINPFVGFPFCNVNIESVAEYIAALNARDGGIIVTDPPLALAIDQLLAQPVSVICNGLDRMQPSQYSALVEAQVEVGSQIASLFQKKRSCACYGSQKNSSCNPCGFQRSWMEPFANWFNVENHGAEDGFESNTKGIAFGFDREPDSLFSVGVGGVWKNTSLTWSRDHGKGSIEGGYGAIYFDMWPDDVWINASLLVGGDRYTAHRTIQYPGVNQEATGSYFGIDGIAHTAAAYYFGSCNGSFFPYASLDYLFFQQPAFTETGSPSFDLKVSSNNSQTLRTEIGAGFRWQDDNRDDTFHLAPELSLGWAAEYPIVRNHYVANFVGQPLNFSAVGWDHTWEIFIVRGSLAFQIYCFTLSADYAAELSFGGQNGSPFDFFSQRCNISLNYRW